MPLTPEQEDEIAAERGASRPTRRATVPALEEILYEALPVLDHGFVRVVDYMGDDGAIVQAARVSYGRGTRRVSEEDPFMADRLRSTRLEVNRSVNRDPPARQDKSRFRHPQQTPGPDGQRRRQSPERGHAHELNGVSL